MARYLAALVLVVLAVRPAAAINHLIVVHEVLGSWQGDDTIQFIELRMLETGQTFLSGGGGTPSDLIFDDASGSAETRRTFAFTHDVTNGAAGATILIATNALATLTGVTPDFVLPPGMLAARAGRVCYRAGAEGLDCVAYGRFTGATGGFGAPVPVTPDNRAIQRVAVTGTNRNDWGSVLEPTPQNNATNGVQLITLCGNAEINQGERCDGALLGGNTCESLGFGSGTLRCSECHLDTSGCSPCGNDRVDPGEQCDGTDMKGKTCASLGFTGGTLVCTERCKRSTSACDPTFYVPGGGASGQPECFNEWRVMNSAGRPGASGDTPVRQACRDGDAGCDADASAGTCAFTIAVCLDRLDPRLGRAGGRPCRREPIESWTLLAPDAAAGGADAEIAAALLGAVAALGTSTQTVNGVVFNPALDRTERCTTSLAIAVPVGTSRLVRARATAAGGRARDTDKLKLVCQP